MTIFIGTDEAGYGPNLGPLTICASVWRYASDQVNQSGNRRPRDRTATIAASPDFYDLLGRAVCRDPMETSREGQPASGRVAIADSKRLYKPGGPPPGRGLRRLEQAVLASLRIIGREPRSWREIWEMTTPQSCSEIDDAAWHADFDHRLPMDCCALDIQTTARLLRAVCYEARLELRNLRAAAVFPAEFNQLVQQLGNKSHVLTATTLGLVRHCLEGQPCEPTVIQCDKHGGRNRYAEALQKAFDDVWVHVVEESRAISQYRFSFQEREIQICFQAKGEQFLPSALASMMAKYLRELAMIPFNQFWQQQVSDLKPTAGYPLDAKRFKQQIDKAQKCLAIADDDLWRRV